MKILPKSDIGQYLDYVDAHLVPGSDEFLVESHSPSKFRAAYHFHASVEINYIRGCDLEYSFSGVKVTVPRGRMTVFWGAVPHGVTNVTGRGISVNVYISLAQLLKWGLPKLFIESLIGGAVIAGNSRNEADRAKFTEWANEFPKADQSWRRLLLGEIEMRLRRMALEGYQILMEGNEPSKIDVSGASVSRYIHEMLRFVAENFGSQISVSDVADHVNLSPSYAMSLFRRAVGIPVKEHITQIRLSHAQMLLANSDVKILSVAMDSGFGSLSSFYEAFQSHVGKTPAAFRRETRQ
ncbi:MAG: AraC family transcriptional regulator [Robiginitomaculum sp.]|nr:MAG: AraC family transcriptional regulator [Robiginitomaculum sp.]